MEGSALVPWACRLYLWAALLAPFHPPLRAHPAPADPGTAEAAHPAPSLASFHPPEGPPGTLVTLEGQGFDGATGLTLGGRNVPAFAVESDTRILAFVPAGAISGPFVLAAPGGWASSDRPFRVLGPGILSFAPLQGPPGTLVTLAGHRFNGTIRLLLGGVPVPAFTVLDEGSLRATVPPGAVTGPFLLRTPEGEAISPVPFTVTAREAGPAITALVPDQGPPGTRVTLSGSGFRGALSLCLGLVPVTDWALAGDGELQATVPPTAVTAPFLLATRDGKAESPPFRVVSQAPPAREEPPPPVRPGRAGPAKGRRRSPGPPGS